MKNILALLALAIVIAFAACKKKSSTTTTTNACAACDTTLVQHLPDTNSIRYYLPTAFTPNGDGRNDVFTIFQTGLNPDSCRITVYNSAGATVFSGRMNQVWDGSDMGGSICPAGKYPVSLHLDYLSGATHVKTDICACVTLLKYSGSCLNTGGVTYHFPDQLHPDSGFIYNTMETICP